MAGDDGDWVVTKPGQQGGAVSSSSPSSSSSGDMGMGGSGDWTVTPTKESTKAAPAPKAADDVPGGSDASTVFMRHLVTNLPGGEDAAAFLDSFSTGKSTADQKKDLQAQEAQDWDEHPWAAGSGAGASILGQAVALPVAGPEELLAQGITRAAPSAVKLAPLLSRAGVGAGYGAVQGGTSGEGLWDWGGAGVGAGIGSAGAAIAPAIGNLAKGVGRWAGLIKPADEAAEKIAGAATADELPKGPFSPPGKGAMSQSDFAKAKATGQGPMAADLGGENVRELADEAALNNPTARATLKDAADARYASQQSRFGDYMDGLFPGKDLDTAAQRDEINLQARQANSTAYNAAYGHPDAQAVWSDNLANLMRDPNVQSAIPKAQSKAASAAVAASAQGRTVPIPQNPFFRDFDGNWGLRVDANGNRAIPSLQWWDYVNRSLGDQVSNARRAGNMDDARVVGGIQKQLQGELDKQVPQFAQARATASGFFNESSLVDAATKFDKTKDEGAINGMLKDLSQRSPEDQEVFARAYGAQLKQRAANPGGQADLVKQFNSPTMATKMQAALNTPSNPTRAQEIQAYMLREQAFNTLRGTFGNSKTAQRAAAQTRHGKGEGIVNQVLSQFSAPAAGAIGGAGLAYEKTPEDASWEDTIKRMGVGGASGAFVGYMAQRRGNIDATTWTEIAKQLASDDPNVYQNAIKRVAQRPQFLKQLQSALTPLAAYAGGQAGAASQQQ